MKLRRPSPSGFSLIEVTIALGIATFCLVALFALLPIGLNTNRDTIEQTIATSIAANIAAEIRASLEAQKSDLLSSAGKSQNLEQSLDLPFTDKSGAPVADQTVWVGYFDEGLQYVKSPANARYRAVVQYFADTDNTNRPNGAKIMHADIAVSWPASLDWGTPANPTSGKNPSGRVDVATAFVAP